MTTDVEFRTIRRELIKSRSIAMRKSASQRDAWKRRRAELQTFLEDDDPSKGGDFDSAGSPDYDLNSLPDSFG